MFYSHESNLSYNKSGCDIRRINTALFTLYLLRGFANFCSIFQRQLCTQGGKIFVSRTHTNKEVLRSCKASWSLLSWTPLFWNNWQIHCLYSSVGSCFVLLKGGKWKLWHAPFVPFEDRSDLTTSKAFCISLWFTTSSPNVVIRVEHSLLSLACPSEVRHPAKTCKPRESSFFASS